MRGRTAYYPASSLKPGRLGLATAVRHHPVGNAVSAAAGSLCSRPWTPGGAIDRPPPHGSP